MLITNLFEVNDTLMVSKRLSFADSIRGWKVYNWLSLLWILWFQTRHITDINKPTPLLSFTYRSLYSRFSKIYDLHLESLTKGNIKRPHPLAFSITSPLPHYPFLSLFSQRRNNLLNKPFQKTWKTKRLLININAMII